MFVGSLFSGIGGIELGFEREGFRTNWFIENNEYCQAILRKNFPDTPIYGDISTIDFTRLKSVDILTGGFPCQDISQANPKGKGIEGERSGLWSYYAEAIRTIRSKYAIIENVPNIANKGLNIVLRDIAEAGYDAEWFCLRASDFGALHQRKRLFIVAYSCSSGCGEAEQPLLWGQPNATRCASSDINHQRQLQLQRSKQDIRQRDNNGLEGRFITDDFEDRIQRFAEESLQGQHGFSWCQDVRRIEDLQGRPDIPEPLFRGGRDGIPFWMDRIKCCGNAVVPQVAQFIARRIKEVEFLGRT